MDDAKASDIAYLSGFADGTRTVVKLTVMNLIQKSIIITFAVIILFLIGRQAPWNRRH